MIYLFAGIVGVIMVACVYLDGRMKSTEREIKKALCDLLKILKEAE